MDKKIDRHLEGIDQERREFIKKLAMAAFVIPVVASFSLKSHMAIAQTIQLANSTSS